MKQQLVYLAIKPILRVLIVNEITLRSMLLVINVRQHTYRQRCIRERTLHKSTTSSQKYTGQWEATQTSTANESSIIKPI